MSIIVHTRDNTEVRTDPAEMAALSGQVFAAAERVPGIAGEGFDLEDWYAALSAGQQSSSDTTRAQPTHLIVRAADEFQAVIPWGQLEGAFFLFRDGGRPLTKGGPLRLYVPDGTSACLNVKSVTSIRIASDPALGEEALYGFRNEISPARLSSGFKSRD